MALSQESNLLLFSFRNEKLLDCLFGCSVRPSIHPSLIYLLISVILGWSLIPAHIRRDTGNVHGTHRFPVYLSANTCRQTTVHANTHTTGQCSLSNSPACPLDYGRKPDHPLAQSWTFSQWGHRAYHWAISCQSNTFITKMFHVSTVRFCMYFSGTVILFVVPLGSIECGSWK